jgi:HSP20 family protein
MSRQIQNLAQFFLQAMPRESDRACWMPSVDVYRRGARGWIIKFDLAGVRPEDVQVELHGGRLTVRGQRRDLSICEGRQAYSMEISYNQFERTVELPVAVQEFRLSSEYRDGMFLVSIEPRDGG